MIMEKNYDFLKRHWTVHVSGRRDENRVLKEQEMALADGWKLGGQGGMVTEKAIGDFQDYLWVSMGVSVGRTDQKGPKTLWIEVDERVEKGFILEVEPESVVVRLAGDREAFRAVVHMEDMMNLEGAPYLPLGELVRRPLYESRSVHSGTGMDLFPDAELLAAVHAGYDAIVLFVKGIDQTTQGHTDINDIIERAAGFGMSVQLYNYVSTFVHPDEPGAQKIFDDAYGELFRKYPGAAAVKLTGESLEFPSKDPHVTGKKNVDSFVDGIPDTRPSPGWYPCYDYPAYLACIERAVHKAKPDAEIIYSTYNWSYQPLELREKFLEQLPKGLTLSICYEIQAEKEIEGLRTDVMDYSIAQDEPGYYFETESAVCKRLGIPVQGNVNTAGIAWDFGCVHSVPAPYKLLNRMRRLRRARYENNVTSHYATHHYGWWNSVAADLGKWTGWEDFEPDYEELLRKIAVRDYGKEAADGVLAAWKLWDEAMDHYVATNEDQYGPWRVGAAYPFIFQPNITRTFRPKEIKFPTAKHAYMGHKIIMTLYQPFENEDMAPGFLRYPAELRSLHRMEALWVKGMAEAEGAAETGNLEQQANLKRFRALGQFILCEIRTTIHIKQWWLENTGLLNSRSQEEALTHLDEIERIAAVEVENTKAAIPAAEEDSRLGWEPSMEYVCDRWHLEWKLRQVESALREVAAYRRLVERAYRE